VRTYEVPGGATIEIEHVVLDLNGTLSDRGELIDGVGERLMRLAADVDLHLLTADTRGVAERLVVGLPVALRTVSEGNEKAEFVRRLGPRHTAAIGNGRNDEAMLRLAALALAVIGSEGAATSTVLAADIVCRSVLEALDLLRDASSLGATLRL
jgi:soluble P-type ATPase